jgi:cytochrome c-type biogenesis protein CcmH
MFCRFCNKYILAVVVMWVLMMPTMYVMAAEDLYNNPQAEESIAHITRDLRCLTCPNESVAESTSPMALDVKAYIHGRLQQGASDRQIISELTERYGEELLYKPLMAPHTIVLWFAPLLALGLGLWLLRTLFTRPALPVDTGSQS